MCCSANNVEFVIKESDSVLYHLNTEVILIFHNLSIKLCLDELYCGVCLTYKCGCLFNLT